MPPLADYPQHRPGTTITQRLAPSTAVPAPLLMSCCIGPRFTLNRFGRETTPGSAFNAAGQELTFRHTVSGVDTALDLDTHTVDLDSLQLYAQEVEALLATFTAAGSPSFVVPDLSAPNILKITNSSHLRGSSLASAFQSRSVQVGDIVYTTGISGGTTYRRRVLGLLGEVASGTFGANTAKNDSNAGNQSSNPVTSTASATQITAPAGWTVGCDDPEEFDGLLQGAKNLTEYGEEFQVTVHTAGSSGTRQVETATVAGTIGASGAGNATVVVTAAGMSGSPITLSVAVANNDTASQVATKIRAALNGNATITGLFQVGGATTAVILTKIVATANDATLNISIDNGTCTGLTAAPTSANTTSGAASVAKVNIGSASGLFAATNVATTTANGEGTFTISDSSLAGVTLVLTPPGSDELAAGMSFRIRVVGDYSRLSTSQIVPSGTYTGVKSTTYMIRVTGIVDAGTSFTGATVTITDTAGVDTPAEDVEITDNTNIDLGNFGLSLKFYGSGNMPTHAGLRVGDIYYVHAVAGAVSSDNFDRMILDGPAVDTLTFTNVATELHTVTFRKLFTGAIATTDASAGDAWEADAESLTVAAGLALYISERSTGNQWCAFVNTIGTLHASYRAFVNAGDDDTLVEVSDAAELAAAVGDTTDPDNILGFAAQQQFLGSRGKTIGVLNTGGSSVEAFETALAKIANTRTPYDLTILSDDTDVWDVVQTHVIGASSEENRHFRRGRLSVDSPGEYPILEKRADTTNFTATISPHGGGNLLLTIVDGSAEALLTDRSLLAGYLVRLPDSDTEYPIASVLSDTELILSSGPGSAVTPAVTVEIWAADTVASQKAWLQAKAASLSERRITLVWCERPVGVVNGESRVLPVMFGAAYLGGVRSDLRPQIGLTRQGVATFVSAPKMYSRYSRQDLDDIASYGVCILEQESAGSPVRVRHQATTDTSNGILNFEESTTVRLDYLSFRFDTALDALVGVVNTTEGAERASRTALLSVLNEEKLVPVAATYGPLIDDYDNLLVARSTQFDDRIESSVDVEFGPPVNRQKATITGWGRLPANAT